MERYYCPRCGERLEAWWDQGHSVVTSVVCISCDIKLEVPATFAHAEGPALGRFGMRASGFTSEWYRKIRERVTEQEAEDGE